MMRFPSPSRQFMPLTLLLFLFFAGAPLQATSPDWAAAFDAQAERGLRELHVPGAAVGVVKDGKVLYARGYGVSDPDQRRQVTAQTLFAMGSVTKSFTALVVASVIDQGKLDWDTPVREYFPWFRLYDPIASQAITLRDMLTHRSGLPRHDFLRFSTYLSREELVRRLRYLEPNRSFRDVYQYNNLMYVAAGYLAGLAAGSTWEDLVRERIFAPLGMERSNTSVLDSQQSDNYASPYARGANGLPEKQEFYVYQKFGVGPNGAVNSCVDDMLKYLEMYLQGGVANGRRIVSRQQFDQLLRPVTVADSTGAVYSPGWRIDFYRGHRRISHGGAITGFRAAAVLLPDAKTGIVAMINAEENLAQALAATLSDHALGLPPEDHIGKAVAARNRPRQTGDARQPEAGTRPSRPLGHYAGRYEHPAYGAIRVAVRDQEVVVEFDALQLPLKHFHYDTFMSPIGLARFVLDANGGVRELHLPLEPAVRPFVFLRVE